MSRIAYRAGYKYQLAASYSIQTGIKPTTPILHKFLALTSDGVLTINHGYAWDGPSGPTVDTKNFMRGSLVHDALYQLMREGSLDLSYRKAADDLLREMCRQDGMSWVRAWWVYKAVRMAGESSAERQADNVIFAP